MPPLEHDPRQEHALEVTHQRTLQLIAFLALLGKRVLRVNGTILREPLVAGDFQERFVPFEARLQVLGCICDPPGPLAFWASRLVLTTNFLKFLLASGRPAGS